MANISLKDIQFPGLNNVYKVPEVDSTLTQSGAAADAKKTGDELSDLKQDLRVSHVAYPVDETEAVNSKYVNQYGNISESVGYAYIDEVLLRTGETLVVKGVFAHNNLAVFSERLNENVFSTYRKPITLSSTGTSTYSYVATKDIVLSITFPTVHTCTIYNNTSVIMRRIDSANVGNNTITLEKLKDTQFAPIYVENENKLDYSDLSFGSLTSAGMIDNNASYKTTTHGIYCYGKPKAYAPSAIYGGYIQALWWAFYDENDEFISRSDTYKSNVDIPNTAYYLRVTFPTTTLASYEPMVCFSSAIPSSFIPFGRTIRKFEEKETGTIMDYMQMFTNIGIVGDSLSSGEVYTQGGTPSDKYNYSWLSNICRKTGAKPHHYSKGGMEAKGWITSQYRTALDDETDNLEAYYIALGTNDKSQSYPVGSASDAVGADSFAGYIKQIIGIIHTKAPNAVIFCVSLYSNDSTSNSYSSVIEDIADLYSYCYYIDFVGNAVADLIIPSSRVYTNYIENWHYTGLGYIGVGNTIKGLTNQIIGDNLADFKFFAANQPTS